MDYQQLLLVDGSNKSVNETQLVQSAMQALLLCWAETKEAPEHAATWKRWLQGPFVKITKRSSSRSKWLAACDSIAGRYDDLQLVYATVPVMEQPPLVHKLQTQGFEREPGAAAGGNEVYEVLFNPNLTMSTGKKIAQACHAAMVLGLDHEVDGRRYGRVVYPDASEWDRVVADGYGYPVRIVDAGRTEIEPGSCTVIARLL